MSHVPTLSQKLGKDVWWAQMASKLDLVRLALV